jgi:hypothetical protein
MVLVSQIPSMNAPHIHGWIIGNHPEFTPTELQLFKGTLVELKNCFAYGMAELPQQNGVAAL